MIASVSSASFASYGRSSHSQGDRTSDAFRAPDEELDPKDALRNAKQKKAEKESAANPQQLDEAEKKQVEDLKKRDAEVRAHEQAHMAAAGSLAQGGPNYVFQIGPDGRQYAIGGSVKIDTSPGNTPEETARKAQQIRAAALAPADPSGQDLKVAAAAASMEVEAASKEAGKTEKDSPKFGRSSGSDTDGPRGEITSSRQVFSASPSESEQGETGDGDSRPRPNAYQIQAAQRYRSQQAPAGF